MRVYDFLLTVASSLGDAKPNAPFRRYPLRDLVAFYNEAMCFVSTHRPDLFTDYRIMKLDPGSAQDARCCGCLNVIEITAQIDADGNTIKDLTDISSSKGDVSKWYRAPCKIVNGATTTVITGITIEMGMNGQFSVSPPVKPGEDIWVKVKCVRAPAQQDEAGVLARAAVGSCQFLPAIRSYVLYRALLGDRHASGAATEAQAEFRNVVTMLGIQYKFEQAQEAEIK